MTEDDNLSLWRLAADLSLEDAAILIAGGDPSALDYVIPCGGYGFEDSVPVKRTAGHPGFTAAFSGLKAAVLMGHIQTTFQYRGRSTRDGDQYPLEKFHLISKQHFLSLIELEDDPFDASHDTIAIDKEPDWSETFVNVDDLKTWLRSRGHNSGFFFSSDQSEPDEFFDKSHEHFSPELALATKAWRALAEMQEFSRSPKAAI